MNLGEDIVVKWNNRLQGASNSIVQSYVYSHLEIAYVLI